MFWLLSCKTKIYLEWFFCSMLFLDFQEDPNTRWISWFHKVSLSFVSQIWKAKNMGSWVKCQMSNHVSWPQVYMFSWRHFTRCSHERSLLRLKVLWSTFSRDWMCLTWWWKNWHAATNVSLESCTLYLQLSSLQNKLRSNTLCVSLAKRKKVS